MRVPSGDHATVYTVPEWPRYVTHRRPVFTSQICTVSSLLPEAMRVPSGDQAVAKTVLVCPRYVTMVSEGGRDAVGVAAGRRGAVAQAVTNRTTPSAHQPTARERWRPGRIMLASSWLVLLINFACKLSVE